MSDFIPGLELSRLFFIEVVQPAIEAGFPDLQYSAALIGPGSEVLGFDTEMSSDHCWGPRLILFISRNDVDKYADAIKEHLAHNLPHEFFGYSTNFSEPDPTDHGTQRLVKIPTGPINHGVDVTSIRKYIQDYLGFNVDTTIDSVDWLTFPEQKLRTLISGAIYYDGISTREVLSRFDYYPNDVWFYLLAAAWNRIGQEEHLMGRAGSVGDEIGSALIGGRLVRDLMRLCFLLERVYAPYPKWFGTAFKQLECAENLLPVLEHILLSKTWDERESHLERAYQLVAEMHDHLGITEPINAKTGNFFSRPFRVIHLHGKFADAISKRISDPAICRLIQRRLIGSIDQISDNTDVLSDAKLRTALRRFYE
jgi:hypothetical protein